MSDCGNEFRNPITNELCELLWINKVYKGAYRLQANEVRIEFIALLTIPYQCTLLSSNTNGIFGYMQVPLFAIRQLSLVQTALLPPVMPTDPMLIAGCYNTQNQQTYAQNLITRLSEAR